MKRAANWLRLLWRLPRLAVVWTRSGRRMRSPRRRVEAYSGYFQPADLEALTPDIAALVRADPYLLWLLSDPRYRRTRSWEYGLLHNYFDEFSSLRVLDVGSGNSTLPCYLSKCGARVVTVDLPAAAAPRLFWSRWQWTRWHVQAIDADAVALPLRDHSFDLVTCISVIEHLDNEVEDGRWAPVDDRRFLERSVRAIDQMARVVRPNGYLYLTTNAFAAAEGEERPGGTYSCEHIEDVLVKAVRNAGMTLVKPGPFTRPPAGRIWPVALLCRKPDAEHASGGAATQ